ncbi:hypothetical protein HGRIS_001637 [Hohenbuehelia grisea]|uniref:Uncharacterized protein n=1 Tax=Hohenbuehelia grisea TaxID=104357 RepID=A0ABR3JJR1_9AGAR
MTTVLVWASQLQYDPPPSPSSRYPALSWKANQPIFIDQPSAGGSPLTYSPYAAASSVPDPWADPTPSAIVTSSMAVSQAASSPSSTLTALTSGPPTATSSKTIVAVIKHARKLNVPRLSRSSILSSRLFLVP